MHPTVVKGLVRAGILGITVAVGVGIYELFSSEPVYRNIREKLSSNSGVRILNTQTGNSVDDSHWKVKISEHSNNSRELKLASYQPTSDGGSDIDRIKIACENVLRKEAKDGKISDEDVKLAIFWCTVNDSQSSLEEL